MCWYYITNLYIYLTGMHGTERRDFHALLSSQNPGIIKNVSTYIYQFINVIIDIWMFALYNYFTFYYVLYFIMCFGPVAFMYK